jgi:hypothetical protein
MQATGLAKFLSCLLAGRCFGNPAIPGAWDPWLSPPPISGAAGPPPFMVSRRPTITRGLALSANQTYLIV